MPAGKPNVLWIFGDQMRAHAMSACGDPNLHTPNLDRLAGEGAHFTHAISGTPWCTPFRGCLLTGKYPHRSGVPAGGYRLPGGTETIAHVFGAQGYRTCYIGKWHLDGKRQESDLPSTDCRARERYIPPERRGGFADWWAYENNNRPFECHVHTGAGAAARSFRLPEYETDSLTDLLLDWMQEQTTRRGEQPFFAVLSVQPPHSPFVAPPEDMARHDPAQIVFRPNVPPVDRIRNHAAQELAGYYAAIERLDANIGRIRAALEDLGIAERTYLFFFSDHGDMLGSHGLYRKSSPWEESIRIPFLIGGAELAEREAQRHHYPLNHVDIAPTTLGLCGIDKPAWMEGYDYAPIIRGERPRDAPPDSAYISMCIPSAVSYAVDRPFRGIVTRDGWKYCVLEHQPWLLFNLNEDPYELINLAHTRAFHPRREQLHERLVRWVGETADRFALPVL